MGRKEVGEGVMFRGPPVYCTNQCAECAASGWLAELKNQGDPRNLRRPLRSKRKYLG